MVCCSDRGSVAAATSAHFRHAPLNHKVGYVYYVSVNLEYALAETRTAPQYSFQQLTSLPDTGGKKRNCPIKAAILFFFSSTADGRCRRLQVLQILTLSFKDFDRHKMLHVNSG